MRGIRLKVITGSTSFSDHMGQYDRAQNSSEKFILTIFKEISKLSQ